MNNNEKIKKLGILKNKIIKNSSKGINSGLLTLAMAISLSACSMEKSNIDEVQIDEVIENLSKSDNLSIDEYLKYVEIYNSESGSVEQLNGVLELYYDAYNNNDIENLNISLNELGKLLLKAQIMDSINLPSDFVKNSFSVSKVKDTKGLISYNASLKIMGEGCYTDNNGLSSCGDFKITGIDAENVIENIYRAENYDIESLEDADIVILSYKRFLLNSGNITDMYHGKMVIDFSIDKERNDIYQKGKIKILTK